MLGPIPRAKTDLPVRQRLAVLHPDERTAVHHRRLLLLFLVHRQPDLVQSDVNEVQAGVPGDVVRPPQEPHVQGPAVQFPGHDRPVEHDDQHHRVPQVGAPAGQIPGRRSGVTRRGKGSARRSVRYGRRRAGNDLAGQRERAALHDVAESHGRVFLRGQDDRVLNLRKPKLRKANRHSRLYRNRNSYLTPPV